MRKRVSMCMPIVHAERPSSIAIDYNNTIEIEISNIKSIFSMIKLHMIINISGKGRCDFIEVFLPYLYSVNGVILIFKNGSNRKIIDTLERVRE
jgi:hypothetical protein